MGRSRSSGLLKMDFLGLRTLTVLANTVALLKDTRGIRSTLETLPPDDPKTYALLSEAKTFGVFQLESAGMARGLRPAPARAARGRDRGWFALPAGPMELIADFISAGTVARKSPTSIRRWRSHRETYGIMVYRSRSCRSPSRWRASPWERRTFSAAPWARRTATHGEAARDVRRRLRERGVTRAKADRVWELMEKFAGYGFNKSHAAAYALVAYQTAYSRRTFPVEFMAALSPQKMGDTTRS